MQLPYVSLRVEATEILGVLSCRGEERLSRLFRYELEAELEYPVVDADALIGAEATIDLRDRAGHLRTVHGVVAEAQVWVYDDERARGRLVVRPHVFRQTLGRDCYASQDVTVRDVVDDVLADYTGKVRWELTRSYPRYPYRAQYREDDWTYVSRLLEEEGIWAWFDHEAGSMLVLADDSRNAHDLPGGPELAFIKESALVPGQDAVTQLSSTGAVASGRFTSRSFDPSRPTLGLAASSGSGRYEHYDAPGGGPAMESILETRTRDLEQATIAARAGASGLAESARLCPGRRFALFGHPLARLDGRWFVTATRVEGSEKIPVVTRFDALRGDVTYRPLRETPEARQAGLQMGQVIGPDGEEVYPDASGRVRTILHWDRLGTRNERGGTWMRVAQRGAPGSMLLPRMGWNVATFNEEGGVDAPSLICRIHDGDHPPPYGLPGNMTRVVWKTATSPAVGSFNEIYFEDRKGAEEMFIHASRDMTYRVRDGKYEGIKNDSLRTVGVDRILEVGESLTEHVLGNQTVTIGGSEKLSAAGARTKTVGGNDTESVGGSRSLKVGADFTHAVGGNRRLQAPIVLDVSLGTISAVTRDTVLLVGGAVVKISGAAISEDSRKVAVQLVGGARVDIAKKQRQTNVNKDWLETVGAGVMLKTNAKHVDNADTSARWDVGLALSAKAPEIHIEAEDSILIRCGESVIEIGKEAFKLTATDLDLSAAHLDADTQTIEHN